MNLSDNVIINELFNIINLLFTYLY